MHTNTLKDRLCQCDATANLERTGNLAWSPASFLQSPLPKGRSSGPGCSCSTPKVMCTQEPWVRAGGPGGKPRLLGPLGFISGAGGGGGRTGGGEGNPKLK